MGAASIADADEASETISEDRARGVEIAPRQGLNLFAAEPIDTAQLDTDGFSSRGRLDRGDDRGLAGGAPAPLTTVAFAADLSVINLDPTGQALARVPIHHHLHQRLPDLPGRGLAQLDASDAPLALGQVVHRAEPEAQPDLGRGEDGPRNERCLPTPSGALIKTAAFDPAVLPPTASRADKPHGPTPAEHRYATEVFRPVDSANCASLSPF
jgi:hypothetical protein